MKIPGLSTLKNWVLAILGGLSAFLYIVLKKEQADHANSRAENAEHNAKAAQMQRDQLEQSNQAASEAKTKGQEKTKDAMEKANNGDFSGLNR